MGNTKKQSVKEDENSKSFDVEKTKIVSRNVPAVSDEERTKIKEISKISEISDELQDFKIDTEDKSISLPKIELSELDLARQNARKNYKKLKELSSGINENEEELNKTSQTKIKEVKEPSDPENKVFDRIKPEKVQMLYMVTILAILFFAATEYYSNISDYMDYGAEESIGTLFAFLIVLYVLSVKFFQAAMKRVSTIIHLIAVFLFSSFFVEMAMDMYLDEAKNITVFDHWYDNYITGKIYFKQGDYKNAQMSFLVSMEELDKDEKGRQEVLFLKSEIELAKSQFRLKDYDKSEQILKDILKGIKSLNYTDKIDVYFYNAKVLNRLEKYTDGYANIMSAREIIREYDIKNNDLLNEVSLEFFLSLMFKNETSVAGGLTIIQNTPKKASSHNKENEKNDKDEKDTKVEEEAIPPEIISMDWPKILEGMTKSFHEIRSPFEKKLILEDISLMGDAFYKKNFIELTLNTYKKYLDLIRDNSNHAELSNVYRRMAELYDKKGERQRAQVYYDLIIESP